LPKNTHDKAYRALRSNNYALIDCGKTV